MQPAEGGRLIRAGEAKYERVKIDVIHSGPLSRTVRAGRMVHRMVPQGGCGRPCLEIAGLGNSLSRIRDAGVKTAQGCRTCRYGLHISETVSELDSDSRLEIGRENPEARPNSR